MVSGPVAEARFAPTPAAPGEARRWAAPILDQLELDGEQRDDILLLLTELVTNVVLHGRTTSTVRIHRGERGVRVVVADDNPRLPLMHAPDPADASGRGLALVDTVASAWGVEPQEAGGKHIWFELHEGTGPGSEVDDGYLPRPVTEPGLGAFTLLHEVARTLAGASRAQDMLEQCLGLVSDALDLGFAALWLPDADCRELRLAASVGHEAPGIVRMPIPFGRHRVGWIAERRLPYLTNDVLRDERFADPGWARRTGTQAFAGYPLLAGDELVGVVVLCAHQPLSDATFTVAAAIADVIATGIARLSAEAELRDRGEVIEILYRVGTELSHVRKLDTIVQAVTDAATELTHADFGAFFYNLLDERGESYTLYTLSGAPRERFEQFPLPRNTAIFEPTFRGTGVVRHDDVTQSPDFGKNPPYHGMPAGHLPVRSYLAAPVFSRSGEVIGGLFFGHAEPGVFDERAERIAVGIAGQAGVALDGARIFELEHRLALHFQRTLLLSDLPVAPGVRLAQRYVPASDYAEVGGDWHDAIALPDGRIALSVGDVVGHDLRAAVTMGRLRHALQVYALEGEDPAGVLRRTDAYLAAAGGDELATAIHAIYDPARRTLTLSAAGHPPPLVRRADGTVAVFDEKRYAGPLLGLSAREHRESATVNLAPGTTIVFYTDGLVERRGESLEDGIARLADALAAADPGELGELCDHLLRAVAPARQDDDIALLVLHVD